MKRKRICPSCQGEAVCSGSVFYEKGEWDGKSYAEEGDADEYECASCGTRFAIIQDLYNPEMRFLALSGRPTDEDTNSLVAFVSEMTRNGFEHFRQVRSEKYSELGWVASRWPVLGNLQPAYDEWRDKDLEFEENPDTMWITDGKGTRVTVDRKDCIGILEEADVEVHCAHCGMGPLVFEGEDEYDICPRCEKKLCGPCMGPGEFCQRCTFIEREGGAGHVKAAYGFYLVVNRDFESMITDMMASDAEQKVEVRVDYYGQVTDFTLDGFCRKLGLKGKGEGDRDDRK